jgi:hypothetical protein
MEVGVTPRLGLFTPGKRTGTHLQDSPPSSAEVKKELSYTSTHPMGPPGPVTGLPFTFTHCTGGWVGSGAGLNRWGKSRLHQDSIPGPSSP